MAEQKQDPEQKVKRRGHNEGSWLYLDELDKWKFRISAKTPDGVTKRFAVTAPTKTECRELAKARTEQIEKGIGLNLDKKKITVGEYLLRWVTDYVDPKSSAATRQTYRNAIKKQLAGKISEIQLAKLQRPAIQQHFNEIAKEWSTATVGIAHVVLHSALKQAWEDRIIGGNPAAGVKLKRVVNEKRVVYSAEDVQKILRIASDRAYRIGVHLVFSLALREGEALGLRWENVDLNKNQVHIIEQLAREKGVTFGPLKTKASKRTVPISPELAIELKSYCTKQKELLLKSGITWTNEMTVVSDAIGQPVSHDRFRREYHVIMKLAGVLSTGCHDARHTRLTQLANTGMDPKTLSRFAGHANVAFTLDRYVEASDTVAAAAVGQADKIIYQAK